MKKYILFFLLAIILSFTIFSFGKSVLANLPSFEVYKSTDKPYPTVTGVGIDYTTHPGYVYIKANVSDVSGVMSVIANIRDPINPGKYMNSEYAVSGAMQDNGQNGDPAKGDGIYSVAIDTTNTNTWKSGTYVVDISATDKVFNNSWDESGGSDYANVGSFVVTGKPSSDTTLKSLTISPGTLSPSFDPSDYRQDYGYTVSVASNINHMDVTPTGNESHQTIIVYDNHDSYSIDSGGTVSVILDVGENDLYVEVFAQDGTESYYWINVTRAGSTDAYLSNLTTTAGAISFSKSTFSYSLNVASTVSSVTVTPTAEEPNATITVNGTTVSSGNASQSITVSPGTSSISVAVTAQDGTTRKTYTVNLTRTVSSDANLNWLSTGFGNVSPGFSSISYSYGITTLSTTSSTSIILVTNDSNATVKINGSSVANNSTTSESLSIGNNTFSIVVTAQDGTTTKTYTLVITRPSADAALSNLAISSGTLSPSFSSSTFSYAASVADIVSSVTVTPTANESHATIKVNGTTVSSGSASGSISLSVGSNTISIVVTAQDGTTTKTYTITVTKGSPFLSGWSYRKKITISTVPNSDLTDFPLLVKISGDVDIPTIMRSDAYDIRFTTADGNNTLLPYEREDVTLNGVSMGGDFWVKMPVYHSPTGSQNTFYIYYGNPSAADGSSPSSVWTNGYSGVWHMSNQALDSTGQHTLTATNVSVSGGQIGSAGGFDGTSSYMNISTGNFPYGTSAKTISAWAKPASTSGGWHWIAAYGNVNNTGQTFFMGRNGADVYGGGWADDLSSYNYWNTSNWKYTALVYNGSTATLYGNGSLLSAAAKSWNTNQNLAYIGRQTNQSEYWDGLIDEVRVSNVARSADWINFEYHNQSDTNNCLTIAAQSSGPSAKNISSFSFGKTGETDIVNSYYGVVTVYVPTGTSLTNLAPTIGITGASIIPASGVSQNFTSPVTYTVTAQDGTTKVYTVNVTLINPTLTSELWTSKTESGWGNYYDPYQTYYHDSRAQFIVTASDLTAAGLTPGSNISAVQLKTYQTPGQSLANFRIKAKLTSVSTTTSWEGGWTTLYGPTTIPNTDTDLSTSGNWKNYVFASNFQWDGISNVMFDVSRDDNSYTNGGGMYMRSGVGTNRMFAGYCDSCANGSEAVQIPYRTMGNEDGTTFTSCPDLKITFQNQAANTLKNILNFGFGVSGETDSIGTSTITINGPIANKTSLTPTITINGASVSPASGVAQDFTNPVVYTVTAQDGSTRQYTVTVNSVFELWASGSFPESSWGQSNDPYQTYYQDSRAQFIVTASELSSIGLGFGANIKGIYLKTYQTPGQSLANFRIKAKLTSASTTTSWEGGWTTLYGPTTIPNTDTDLSTSGNWKNYVFASNFQWDGTSNVMFDISRDDSSYTQGGGMYVRSNVGTNRMFAGDCDSCITGPEGLQIPYRTQGSDNGSTFSSCPDLKINYSNISTSPTTTAFSSATSSSGAIGSNITLAATLTGPSGALANQIVAFRDDTDNINIGSFTTDSSGIAQTTYQISADASISSHTFKAIFAGNTSAGLALSQASKAINIAQGPTGVVELWKSYSEGGWSNPSADPYNVYYQDSRLQFIVTAADLIGAGLHSGVNLNAIYLRTWQQPGDTSNQGLTNFRIKAKLTSASTTTSWEGGWTTLYGPTTIARSDPDLATVGNWKKYTFTQNFQWNGGDNIMFDISRDDSYYTEYGDIYTRYGVGTNRSFAGYCDSCANGPEGVQIPYRTMGSNDGSTYNDCPELKISYANN